MSLRFICGDAGSDRSGTLIRELTARSIAEPSKNFFIIVPEQFTLQTQKILTSSHPDKGILNIDVLSFERLAYRVFEETGTVRRALLEESGKRLILKKILLDEKANIPYLGSRLGGDRSADDLKSLISELMQYNITPEKLRSLPENSVASSGEKIKDIAYIYEKYREYLAGSYMTVEEIPLILSKVLDRSLLLKDSVVAFDGFTGFTPVQLPVIRKLLKTASDVYVTIIMPPGEASVRRSDPFGLFRMSHDTADELKRMAAEENTVIEDPVCAEKKERDPYLRYLSDNIYRRRRPPHKDIPSSVHISACATPLEEVRLAASLIKRLIRTKGMRYRDIAIVSGDPGTYSDLIKRVFPDVGIPFFIDDKSSILTNPFVELIRAALSVIDENFSYSSVFRMLKTGLTDLDDETVCMLENYAVTLGIRGRRKWEEGFLFYSPYEDEDLLPDADKARQYVCDIMKPLTAAFSEKMSTVREKTVALYEFITSLNCQKKLAVYSEAFEKDGRGELAAEYARIYKAVMDILDKTVSVLGDQKISVSDYTAILESVLGDTRMGFIPPGNDQVTAGDIKRTRLSGVKALLFLGVNDGLVPSAVPKTGLITENERRLMEKADIILAPSAREALLTERFYLYLTLSVPTEELYISYSLNSQGGDVLKPSSLTGSIKRIFPALEAKRVSMNGTEYMEHPENALSLLTSCINDPGKRPAFLELYKYLKNDPEYSPRLDTIAGMAERDPVDDTLGRAVSSALYGTGITVSPTRLEMYAGCRFRHFLTHGLRLKERQEFVFNAMDMGNMIHRALEWYSLEIRRRGIGWCDIPEAERDTLCEKAIDLLTGTYGNRILNDNARTAYEAVRLKRLLKRTVWALTAQLSKGDFVPYAFEEKVFIPLTDDINLTGVIDRIDICDAGDRVYVKTIDYKTGSTKFDIMALYNGIQLQLPLYMNAALEKIAKKTGKPALPAAMFYYNVNDPIANADKADTSGESVSRDNALLDALLPEGLMGSSEDILLRLDRTLSEPGRKSTAVNVSTTKSGAPSKNQRLIPPESFGSLGSFADKKASELADHIISGVITISPFRDGSKTACDYCPFRSVCRFDPASPGQGYRLPAGDPDKIRQMITGEGD